MSDFDGISSQDLWAHWDHLSRQADRKARMQPRSPVSVRVTFGDPITFDKEGIGEFWKEVNAARQHINTTPSWPESDGPNLANKEYRMNDTNNIFGNMPGGNKFMDRMFRKADGVVWDMMTGRVGLQTDDGIATITGTGDDAQIEVNLLDQFGMALPAFAQSTPVAAVNVGDLIIYGASDRRGWVIEKKDASDPAKQPKFVLLKVDGTRSTWSAPKVSMLGMESGVMVLRSLMSMLPGGAAGLQGMQNNMMMMMQMSSMMGGGDEGSFDMTEMMPMMLMGQMLL